MFINSFKSKKGSVSILSCNGSININGVVYSGKNISIENDKVIIDGVVLNEKEPLVGPINIHIEGNVERLEAVGDIVVNGDVRGISTTAGDIEVGGNIAGNVSTVSGDIRCRGVIRGNINTVSGDIVGCR